MDKYGLLETAGQCVVVFYEDDGVVGLCDPDWLQHVINVLVGLFRRYGMAANVEKLCRMTCEPVALQAGILEQAMVLNCTGVGDLY